MLMECVGRLKVELGLSGTVIEVIQAAEGELGLAIVVNSSLKERAHAACDAAFGNVPAAHAAQAPDAPPAGAVNVPGLQQPNLAAGFNLPGMGVGPSHALPTASAVPRNSVPPPKPAEPAASSKAHALPSGEARAPP